MTDNDAALGALAPVVRAEQRRGNSARILVHESQLRGDPPEVYFRYPMDREALHAEFDFGSRIEELGPVGGVLSGLRDKQTECSAYDGTRERGWWARRRTADWWADWNASPRSRTNLDEFDAE